MKINNKSIYIGTSGYKYDDWIGAYYPKNISKQEMLDYYCNHFNFLELTYTYYKIPSYGEIMNIFSRSKNRCKFAVRLPHIFLKGKYNQEDIKNLFIALSPILESDKFFGFFADFSFRFNACKANLEYLIHLGKIFTGYDLFVELINATWYKERFLTDITNAGIGIIAVDLPEVKGLAPFFINSINYKSYIRLYGKSSLWLTPETKELNYCYDNKILINLSDNIAKLDASKEVAVSFCNVVDAYAPKNALSFKEIVKGRD